MEIFVCVKRVPDVSDVDVAIAAGGRSIVADDLSFGMNEWDNFAVEEAIRLREQHGGSVTAISIGTEDSEEELRRALAMGADHAILVSDPAFSDLDAHAAARILHAVLASKPFDLVLTGAVASDTGAGQVGGMLAAMLDVPQVSLATGISIEGKSATVQHEVEGGLERVVEVSLPAVVSVQTGLNEPRYVSIRGIRKVSGAVIPTMDAAQLGISPTIAGPDTTRVKVLDMAVPPSGKSAEILEGSTEEVVDTLINRLQEQGGL